jgi:hypothetical protein
MRKSRTAVLADLIEGEQVDAKERTEALRLQAKAWRLLAVIAVHDPEYAKKKIGWLMFVTVPYVSGEVVARFIEEHQDMAVDYGRKAGVFTDQEVTHA